VRSYEELFLMKASRMALLVLLSILFGGLNFLSGAGRAPLSVKQGAGQANPLFTKVNSTGSPFTPDASHALNADAEFARRGAPLRHGHEILFIGNSLTGANDLPCMLQALAAAAGQRPFVYEASIIGGASIEDQWNAGAARRAISSGKFQIVVLQQGPSAQPASQVHLLKWTRMYAREIRAARAQPALYMVWPFASRPQDFDGVSVSYSTAAKAVGGILFPVGEAWRAALRRDPNLQLYLPDGLHPTVAGTYLAALVMYQRLYLQSPIGLPARFVTRHGAVIDLPPQQAGPLQEAAAEANLRFAL
jgi:hypothetical protein